MENSGYWQARMKLYESFACDDSECDGGVTCSPVGIRCFVCKGGDAHIFDHAADDCERFGEVDLDDKPCDGSHGGRCFECAIQELVILERVVWHGRN